MKNLSKLVIGRELNNHELLNIRGGGTWYCTIWVIGDPFDVVMQGQATGETCQGVEDGCKAMYLPMGYECGCLC